jgi:hypothetical protein
MLPICGQQSKIHFITFSDKVHEPWKVRVPGNPLSDAVAKENLVVYTSMKEVLIGKLRDTFVKKYPCEQKRSLRQNRAGGRPGQSQGAGPAFPLSTLGRATAEGRPSDIDVSRSETETRGLIKRRVFLGPIIDYRVEVGGQEIRVQQDTEETLTGGPLFTEGEACHLQFHHVKWFDEDSLNQDM